MTLSRAARSYPQPPVTVRGPQGTAGHVSAVFFMTWVVFLWAFAL